MRRYRRIRFGADPDLDQTERAMVKGNVLLYKAIGEYATASKKLKSYYSRNPQNSWAKTVIGLLHKLEEELAGASFYDNEAAGNFKNVKKNA